jgi:hypothetical protein
MTEQTEQPRQPPPEHQPQSDEIAITPAIGPLPPVYVPQRPGAPAADSLLWHVAARAVRLARVWVIRHPRRDKPKMEGQ